MRRSVLGNAQVSVEYVVWAIRHVAQVSGRKVSIIGHSQGAFLPSYALRF
jgi:triacylglycerol lipase